MEKGLKVIIFGLILGASLIGASFVVSNTFLGIKKLDNVISVSGSAKLPVTSDNAIWSGSFSRTAPASDLASGYAKMKEDEKVVSDFLAAQGFAGKFEISPVFMNEIYKEDDMAPKEYNLVQNIQVKSDDVVKMKELAKKAESLAGQGIIFSANAVEYYYSKLPEMRISLLPEAIKDAKARAEAIAGSSGRKVDAIRAVSMGVIQVMPVGAVDISDYGSYDTSSIDKEVMATVKVTFGLK